jgi:hypothetical protein
MNNRFLSGSLTAVYSSTQLTNGLSPKLGDRYEDEAGAKKYIFLQNSGSSAITASLVCMALTTDKTNFKCTLAAATDALIPFAGVRVVGATSMAQNECGWFQVSGPASFLHSGGAATVAEQGIVSSATVAGKVEGAADTAAGVTAAFAIAVAAKTTLDEVQLGNIITNVWGV